jgi:hypothetical protein
MSLLALFSAVSRQGGTAPSENFAKQARTHRTRFVRKERVVELTLPLQSETFGLYEQTGAGVTMRIGTWALLGVLAGAFSMLAAGAEAQTAAQGTRVAQTLTPDDLSARPVRPQRRIRVYPRAQVEPDGVYPRYNPGPNAVRVCNASYVQEYRPSGTVIVPHMTCVWRHG